MMRGVASGIRSIVVGFDESGAARRALERATVLADALGAKLVVTSVAEIPIPGPGLDPAVAIGGPERMAELSVNAFDDANARLDEARELIGDSSVEVEYVPESGVPADRILAVAEERDADLIVVGTREPGFLERLFEGSVSQDVSRHSHRDVLIVH